MSLHISDSFTQSVKSPIMLLLPLTLILSRRNGPLTWSQVYRSIAMSLVTVVLTSAISPSDCQAEQLPEDSTAHVMREGTRIPPTVGRVAMLGRRWIFVPVQRENATQQTAESSRVNNALLVTEVERRPELLGASTRRGNDSLKRFRSGSASLGQIDQHTSPPFQQIVLQENLMLQRIVKAIREDANDDHWTVSGEVTEFFNENRLSVQVAQRANSR